MADDREGVAGIVAEAFEQALAPSQPALFENFDGPPDAKTPIGAQVPTPRGPGRPPGAGNRRHEALRAWYLARFKHPLEALGELVSLDAVELARHLGGECTPLEVLDLQRKALADILPYVESRQPVELDAGEGGLVPIIVFRERSAPLDITPQGVGRRLSVLDQPTVENQGVSEAPGDVSQGEKSHGEPSG